jgi:transglutaminase superfamily protein
MWERLRRFRALEAPARILFFRAAVLLPLISLSLKTRGFRKTLAHLQRHFSEKNRVVDAQYSAQRVALTARMVRAAMHHGLGHPACLEESLAVWFLLGREGIDAQVRVGVRNNAKKFEAHAWVEYQGRPLNEAEGMHQHFAAFEEALATSPAEGR